MKRNFYQICDYCKSSCIINIAYIIIINTINLVKQRLKLINVDLKA